MPRTFLHSRFSTRWPNGIIASMLALAVFVGQLSAARRAGAADAAPSLASSVSKLQLPQQHSSPTGNLPHEVPSASTELPGVGQVTPMAVSPQDVGGPQTSPLQNHDSGTFEGDQVLGGQLIQPNTTATCPAPSDDAGIKSGQQYLTDGHRLTPGQFITSPAGNFYFVQQADGNLVLHGDYSPGGSIFWASNPPGNYTGQSVYTVLQSDGNLVTYASGVAIWSTKSSQYPGTHLFDIQNNGDIVLYQTSFKEPRVIWFAGCNGITYLSQYSASFSIANVAPSPDVTNTQMGFLPVTLTNTGALPWTNNSTFVLSYDLWSTKTAEDLVYYNAVSSWQPNQTVAPGETVTVNAQITHLPPGSYRLYWDMMTGGQYFH